MSSYISRFIFGKTGYQLSSPEEKKEDRDHVLESIQLEAKPTRFIRGGVGSVVGEFGHLFKKANEFFSKLCIGEKVAQFQERFFKKSLMKQLKAKLTEDAFKGEGASGNFGKVFQISTSEYGIYVRKKGEKVSKKLAVKVALEGKKLDEIEIIKKLSGEKRKGIPKIHGILDIGGTEAIVTKWVNQGDLLKSIQGKTLEEKRELRVTA